MTNFFSTDGVCGVCDKYQVCVWVHTAQSIKHANILKKLISQTPGGRIVAIFGMEDLDPLYFDVSNISVQPPSPLLDV